MSGNALDSITIRGYKSITSIENLELRPINVLIGANGSGKSNFVGAFSFLREIAFGGMGGAILNAGGAHRVLHFGRTRAEEIEFALSFRENAMRYEIRLRPNEVDQLFPAEERIYEDGSMSRLTRKDWPAEAGISDPQAGGVAKKVSEWIASWRLYRSILSPERWTARLDENAFLRPDGKNLGAFLYYLREKHEHSYRLIERTVQMVVPFFGQFRLEPSKLQPDYIRLEWQHRGSDENFDAASLSDGTYRFIVLTTLLLQPKEEMPLTILIDEPEAGLHPQAIQLLGSMIRQASHDTQLIVSTQSSQLIDGFEPEDVLVVEHHGGATSLKRLASHSLSAWLDDYSLGELWQKNQFGGRAVRD